jgi:hypothetical protein
MSLLPPKFSYAACQFEIYTQYLSLNTSFGILRYRITVLFLFSDDACTFRKIFHQQPLGNVYDIPSPIDSTHLANKINLGNNLFLVYSSISTFRATMGPSIRRNNCDFATLGTCYSVWMTVWYAGWNSDSHPHRITSTKCLKNTAVSPDHGSTVARNVENDKYTKNKFCTKLVLFTRLYKDARSTKYKI